MRIGGIMIWIWLQAAYALLALFSGSSVMAGIMAFLASPPPRNG